MPALTTTHQVQSQSQSAATVVVQQTGTNTAASATSGGVVVTQSPAQRNDNAKEKCRKFLTNLIDLSKREPAQVEMNVKTLIQELVDANVGPEDFCKKLENLLNAAPQPCLVGFLKVCYIFQDINKNHIAFSLNLIEKPSTFEAIACNKRNCNRRN